MAVDWRCWPGIGHYRQPNTMMYIGSVGVSVTLREAFRVFFLAFGFTVALLAIECPFYVNWSGAKGLKPSWPYVVGTRIRAFNGFL